MLNYILGAIFALHFLLPVQASAHHTLSSQQQNMFAYQICNGSLPQGWTCRVVATGSSWSAEFPDQTRRLVVQKFNRQNTILKAGQFLVVPPERLTWQDLSPFAQRAYQDRTEVIIFDPARLAWAHYQNGSLVTWGPAVGGKSWCADVQRSCYTDVGEFIFTEAAGPNRRSSSFPIGCRSRGTCAPMPRFTRFTNGGQGFHERSMQGSHASHGCVGLFAGDIRYLSVALCRIKCA